MSDPDDLQPPSNWPPAEWPPAQDDPIAMLDKIVEMATSGPTGYRDALGSYLIAMIDLENAIDLVVARHVVGDDDATQGRLRALVLERLSLNPKLAMLRQIAKDLGVLPGPAKQILKQIEGANALRNDLAHGKGQLDDEDQRNVAIGSAPMRPIVSIRSEARKVDELRVEVLRMFAPDSGASATEPGHGVSPGGPGVSEIERAAPPELSADPTDQ